MAPEVGALRSGPSHRSHDASSCPRIVMGEPPGSTGTGTDDRGSRGQAAAALGRAGKWPGGEYALPPAGSAALGWALQASSGRGDTRPGPRRLRFASGRLHNMEHGLTPDQWQILAFPADRPRRHGVRPRHPGGFPTRFEAALLAAANYATRARIEPPAGESSEAIGLRATC